MRINTLLAAMVSRVPAEGYAVPERSGTSSERQRSATGDAFTQGEWWKNLASGRVAGSASCSCGSCSACAARAYGRQGAGQAPLPAPGAEASRNGAGGSGATNTAAMPGAAGNGAQGVGSQENGQGGGSGATQDSRAARPEQNAVTGPKGMDGEPLSQAELLRVSELRQIDTEVKAHEMAHVAAAGAYVRSGASFQYATGPDGRQYAVGGEVGIDTSEERTPQATISKMQTVRAAALAPANPSPQDRNVAARASMVMTQAGQEMRMMELDQASRRVNGSEAQPSAGKVGGAAAAGADAGQPGGQAAEETGRNEAAPANADQRAMSSLIQGLNRPQPTMNFSV
ncbi:MAG: putative metalloprotease CJM1_0395 family protein [Thermodesulfobacteriota bacterium]